jgi:hypothetical protein
MCAKFLSENLEERGHLEDLSICGDSNQMDLNKKYGSCVEWIVMAEDSISC